MRSDKFLLLRKLFMRRAFLSCSICSPQICCNNNRRAFGECECSTLLSCKQKERMTSTVCVELARSAERAFAFFTNSVAGNLVNCEKFLIVLYLPLLAYRLHLPQDEGFEVHRLRCFQPQHKHTRRRISIRQLTCNHLKYQQWEVEWVLHRSISPTATVDAERKVSLEAAWNFPDLRRHLKNRLRSSIFKYFEFLSRLTQASGAEKNRRFSLLVDHVAIGSNLSAF